MVLGDDTGWPNQSEDIVKLLKVPVVSQIIEAVLDAQESCNGLRGPQLWPTFECRLWGGLSAQEVVPRELLEVWQTILLWAIIESVRAFQALGLPMSFPQTRLTLIQRLASGTRRIGRAGRNGQMRTG